MWVSLKNNCDSVTVTGIGRRASSKTQKHNKILIAAQALFLAFILKSRTISHNKWPF